MRKKVFKIILWCLLGLFLLLSGGVAVGVYWVLTPERLTATLRSQMKSMLLCKSDIGSVEVKLFAGYKVLSVEVRNVVLRNPMEGAEKDTILETKRAYLQVDWMKWWKFDQLDIQQITLEKPRLYYFVNAHGKNNWDIFPSDTASKSTSSALPFKEAMLPLLEVKKAALTYVDLPGKMEARIDGLDFSLSAQYKNAELGGWLACSAPLMRVRMNQEEMWKGYPLQVKTTFRYQTNRYRLHIGSLHLASRDIQLNLQGDVQGDSLFTTWNMNLKAQLQIPQIQDVIERIPASMDDALAGIGIQGKGSLEGSVQGVFGPHQMPEIDFRVSVPQMQVKMADFADMPVDISEAKMRIYGDLDKPDEMKAQLQSVKAKLMNSEFSGEGELSQLTGKMHFAGKVNGNLHMQTISAHFLDTLGYHVQGNVRFDAQLDLSMEALQKQEWQNIQFHGTADYADLKALSAVDTMAFQSASGHVQMQLHPQSSDGRLWFMGLKGLVNAGQVEMKGKETARFERLNLDTRTSNFMDTTRELEAAVVMDMKEILVPQNALQIASPPQPMRIPACSLDLLWTPEQSDLHQARLEMMGSDLTMTGQLKHFSAFLLGKEKLWGRLNVESDQLDLGALVALGASWGVVEAPPTKPETVVQANKDTTVVTTGPFMLPNDVDLEMHVNVKSALYGTGKWSHILGAVTLKEGKLLLDKLKVSLPAGQVQLTALYRTPRKNHLFAGFDFHMVQVQMEELIHMIPNIDSIMPMLKSFSGKAEFHMVGETYMDSLYNLKKSTLRGAASIAGQNLILKDGHEFTEIARTLKFSKKNRILVDSLSAELTLFKNEVDVFPFQISMENYKAVISGRHNLDMSFNYHISVTDSPLPFRLGVDVYGNMKDMHFRLAPVRYGYRYRPAQQHTVETQALNLRKMIKASLAEGSSPQ